MKKILDALEALLKICSVACAAALILVVLLQICGRYIFETALPWSEELSRLLLVLNVTVAAPLAVRGDRYVRVDILTNHLPKNISKPFVAVTDLLVAGFLALVSYHAISLIKTGALQKTPMLKLPMSYAYGCVLVCSVLCAVFFTEKGVNTIKSCFAAKSQGGGK